MLSVSEGLGEWDDELKDITPPQRRPRWSRTPTPGDRQGGPELFHGHQRVVVVATEGGGVEVAGLAGVRVSVQEETDAGVFCRLDEWREPEQGLVLSWLDGTRRPLLDTTPLVRLLTIDV